MTPKLLFGFGIGFGIAGLALSLSPALAVQLAGSAATLLAIGCTVWIAFITRNIPVDSSMTFKNRRQMGIAWTFVGIACVLTLFVEFRWNSFGHQAASIMLFMLCTILLLQQRAQGKIS